jgi:hypothetical protein
MVSKADGKDLVQHLEGGGEGESEANGEVNLDERMKVGSIQVRRKVLMNVQLLSEDGAIADLEDAQRMARREREEEEKRQHHTALVKMALRLERDLEEVVRAMELMEAQVEEEAKKEEGGKTEAAKAEVKAALTKIASKNRQLGMMYMQVGNQNKARSHLLEAAHLFSEIEAAGEDVGKHSDGAAGVKATDGGSMEGFALLPCSSSVSPEADNGAACGSSEDIGRVARAFKEGVDPLNVPLSALSESFPEEKVPVLDRAELPAHMLPNGSQPLTEVRKPAKPAALHSNSTPPALPITIVYVSAGPAAVAEGWLCDPAQLYPRGGSRCIPALAGPTAAWA